MSSNQVQDGKRFTYTATAAVTVGDIIVYDGVSRCGIAQKTAALGEEVELAVVGVFDATKFAATAAYSLGAGFKVSSTKKVMRTGDTGEQDTTITHAHVWQASVNGDTTVRIKII